MKMCLADLPMEIIHEIMARAAMPIYKWSGRRSREAARASGKAARSTNGRAACANKWSPWTKTGAYRTFLTWR